MLSSIWDDRIQQSLQTAQGRAPEGARALADGGPPFPSPADWRDVWIYFLMVDRFNNPAAPPRLPWDGAHGAFQGGTFDGIRTQLDYLRDLGVGAIWLSPVQKNCQYLESYHGYGIQDFVAIDPRYASDPAAAHDNPALVEQELRDLVDAAHARGIYVIFDIVLNHSGDVFEYTPAPGQHADMLPWRSDPPYDIHWRDEHGHGRSDWAQAPADPTPDAAIWPQELRHNDFMRRRGNAFDRASFEQEAGGDFFTLKEFVTDFFVNDPQRGPYYPVRDTLIRAYQYLMAKFDVDGYRIDTLKYIEPEFAQVFGNAMREYALSIGKKNFFTYGEVYDDEEKIAHFIGRNAMSGGDLTGVDAALDFPLFFRLPQAAKGLLPPSAVVQVYTHRREVARGIISSHGDASKFFVTFLDNHDQPTRLYYSPPDNPHAYDDQVSLAVGCLFTLQGIPCLYYGTEQGLHGSGGSPEAVREALWGKPAAFDREHPFYQAIQTLSALRQAEPALRYGRQYFRPLSGDGVHFGISTFAAGVLAYSRVLQDQEVLVVANTNAAGTWTGEVVIDFALNPGDVPFDVLYSNQPADRVTTPSPAISKPDGSVEIHEVEGAVTQGPARTVRVTLQPGEIQILTRRRSG